MRNHVLALTLLAVLVLGCSKQSTYQDPLKDNRTSQTLPPEEVKPSDGTHFSRVFIVVLENTDAKTALKQDYLKRLTQRGTYLDQFFAAGRPSQANYIAMTSGSKNGVKSNKVVDLDVKNIADLLEAQKLTWKAYVEDFPGNCFTGARAKNYQRKHNPFISYLNIQKNSDRCSRIVNSSELQNDVTSGRLPNYSFYVPNMKNDGHDTNVKYASKWLEENFEPLLQNPQFMNDMLFVVTFDEGRKYFSKNQVYTVLLGDSVKAGYVSKESANFYDLLRTIEDNFSLGNLGKSDSTARGLTDIWK